MRRKSIAAFMLFSILLFSISLFGCGNLSRNRSDFTRLDSADGTNNGINNPDGSNGGNSANLQDRTNAGGSSTGANGTGTNNTGSTNGTNNMQFGTDTMKYGPENLKNDISNAGYKLIELPNAKVDYFKGSETDYKLGGDTIRLYEYNTVRDLDEDINRISPDGLTINGTKAYTASNKPHYYRKGNSLIVYEGNEPAYIDEFGRLYGNTLRP